jgi:hypothetical protein
MIIKLKWLLIFSVFFLSQLCIEANCMEEEYKGKNSVSENNFKVFKAKYTYEEFQFAREQVKKLPRKNLTESLLDNVERTFVGHLYNKDLKKYVQIKYDNKWLYANEDKRDDALEFTVRKLINKDIEVMTKIGRKMMYLNWRNLTGAAKLYDSYDHINFTNWNDDVFKIRDNSKQCMGIKSLNNELYYGDKVYSKHFQFHFIDEESLNEIQKNIFKCYKYSYEYYIIVEK